MIIKSLDGIGHIKAAVFCCCLLPLFLAADTCTWIGGSTGKWSDTGNWADGIAPRPGVESTVVFDLADADIDCENDIEGLVIYRLLAENGTKDRTFTLRGKGITITGGQKKVGSFSGSSVVHCYVPLTLTSDTSSIVSANGISYFYGGLTLTGDDFYFSGGSAIYFYDNPVVGPDTVFQSGGSNMTCYFYTPLKVKKVVAGINGCNGNCYFYCTGNEWEQVIVRFYGTFLAAVENAFPTNMVFEWYKDYTLNQTGRYIYEIRADQVADRISQPEPFLGTNGQILPSVLIRGIDADVERVLTLRGTDNALAYCTLENTLSLIWDPTGDYTQTFADRVHSTKGSLIVAGGTLASGGTNRFANVKRLTVLDGATFAVVPSALNAAANPFAEKTELFISGTGKVSVPSGVTLTFSEMFIDNILQPAGIYQASDGTDASAKKVDWITGGGLVQVVSCNGTSWIGTGTGDWGDKDNWSNGLPSSHPDGVVYIMNYGGSCTAEMTSTDPWPRNLVLGGTGVTLRVTGDITYDGTDKTAACELIDGAVLRVEGAELMLTNYVGTFTVGAFTAGMSVTATSKIEVASGRFCYAPEKEANYPLVVMKGGAIDACGGIFQAPGSKYNTVDMQGGTILASGEGAVTYAGSGKTASQLFRTATMIFSDNSSFSWGSGLGVMMYPYSSGETLYVSFRDHARQATTADGFVIGAIDRITIAEYASDAEHAKFGNRLRINGGRKGYGELRVSNGTILVGGRGFDVGEASGTLTNPVDARFFLSGGTFNNDGSNGAWADQDKQNGFTVGYAANATSESGRIVKGTAFVSGGTYNVKSGVTLIGTGYAVGRYTQTGGTLNHKNSTQVFGVGQAGGEGWFIQSNGTVSVAGPAYVGGFWTNVLSKAENSPWPMTLHNAEGTFVFAGGTATFSKGLVLGADGRGTLVREGSAGTFTVTGDLVLSNTVENAASGGTLRFVYDSETGVAPLEVSGKLVIRDGAKIEVDLGEYASRTSYKSKLYLVKPAGGIEGDLDDVDVTFTGEFSGAALVKTDEGGLYAAISKGLLILMN